MDKFQAKIKIRPGNLTGTMLTYRYIFRLRRVILSWAVEPFESRSGIWQTYYSHNSSAQTGNFSSFSQNPFLVWWTGKGDAWVFDNFAIVFLRFLIGLKNPPRATGSANEKF